MGLEDLKKQFNPQYSYKNNIFSVEVKGVFVTINEDIADRFYHGNVEIPIEDFLQDPQIIRSARVSTGRDTKEVNERAGKLIPDLYGGHHETPFEGGVMFKLRVKAPICYARKFFQLHSTHNEFSSRYSVIDEDLFIPDYASSSEETRLVFEESAKDGLDTYNSLLKMNVAKEQSRFALPYRYFTKFYWTISLRHLLELLSFEECDNDPFWTVRPLIEQMLKDWTPWTYEAYREKKHTIPTLWKNDIESISCSPIVDSYDNVKNIGEISLISVDVDERLFKHTIKTTPDPRRGLAFGSMVFSLRIPIFVYRQWVRHRNGKWAELPFNFLEIVREKNFYVPEMLRMQTGKTMEYAYENLGSDEYAICKKVFDQHLDRCIARFFRLLKLGLSSDQASLVLPYTFRINVIWKVDCESLMNFFSLRCDMHAQWEIRQLAVQIYSYFRKYFPWTNSVFQKYFNYGKNE